MQSYVFLFTLLLIDGHRMVSLSSAFSEGVGMTLIVGGT
jgi:hypothetical protein